MKITKFVIVIGIALAVSACQTTDYGKLGGALLGGAAGGFGGSKIGSGTGRLLATAGGTLLGAFGGALFGNSITKPYDNENRIDQNGYLIDRNGRQIQNNRMRFQRIPNNSSGRPLYGYQREQQVQQVQQPKGLICKTRVRNGYAITNCD
jgi:hypothetical protein